MNQTCLGGCLCREVRYTLAATPTPFVACHCRDCQYASGGGPAHVLVVPRDALTLTSGDTLLRSYTSISDSGHEVTRQFCGHCGTPMFETLEIEPEIRLVKAGTLDDGAGLTIDATAWTVSAQPWSHIDRTTRLFERNPEPPLATTNL